MIIDFRTRPPMKGFLNMNNLFNTPLHPSMEPIPSREQRSLDLYFKEMDEAGIVKGCLLGRDATGAWSGMPDEDIAAVRDEYPDKFIGFGAVDPARGVHEIVEKAEYGIKTLKLRGMVVEPGNSSPALYADDRRLYPFYDRCMELNAIIIITLSQLLGPDLSFIDPTAVQRAARDFPKAKFVIAHAGYPYVEQAIALAFASPNIWLLPDSYIACPAAPGREMYVRGLDFLCGQKMLFGTAYPFVGMAQAVNAVKNQGLRQEYLDRYFYKNAQELLEI